MSSLDKNYLSLQFRLKAYQKTSTEFQSFFESIVEAAFGDAFIKIRPYGNDGDGGNDGYIPSQGKYFQVYAPLNPTERDAVAASKFKTDFLKLREKWDGISKVKQFNFVFNEKYLGLTRNLESARAELAAEYPEIEFKILTAKDIESIFLSLPTEKVSSLGFDVDSGDAINNAKSYLTGIEEELNRGNISFALKALESIKESISTQGASALVLEYEIILAKTLTREERVTEAITIYEDLSLRYPHDPRPFLYLAEIYLNQEDHNRNKILLEKAESIDADHWLLRLEKLIRSLRLSEDVDLADINEDTFPSEPRIRADFYRIFSVLLFQSGDTQKAQEFIEKAIQLNPEKFSGYDVMLGFKEQNILSDPSDDLLHKHSESFFQEAELIESKFKKIDGLSPRNELYLQLKRLRITLRLNDLPAFEALAKRAFGLIFQCHFDYSIDRSLIDLIRYIGMPDTDLAKLTDYLKRADKSVSSDLARVISLQFIHRDVLDSEGRVFFRDISNNELIKFINDLQAQRFEEALSFALVDPHYGVNLATSPNIPVDFRRMLIESLPLDKETQKDKLLLLLQMHLEDFDAAFETLKKLPVKELNYIECLPAIEVTEKKEAWDLSIPLLEKLIDEEKEPRSLVQWKLKLFSANFKLERYVEVARIGKELLETPGDIAFLDDTNKEIVLGQVVHSLFKRNAAPDALLLVEANKDLIKSFQGKVGIEAEAYIHNHDGENALRAVVEGIKILKRPSLEEYGSLFFITTQIGNLVDLPLDSEPEIGINHFVKFEGEDKWYFTGDSNELDAIKVPSASREQFLGKHRSDVITMGPRHGSETRERKIEQILSIEKYIIRQSVDSAQRLSIEGMWDAMEVIEVPTTEFGIDTKYLEAKLSELSKRGEEFFKTYISQNLPFAMLATSEGSFTSALAKIATERKGYIHITNGTVEEFEQQKAVARRLLAGESFYIDGTAAFFLAEPGILPKIYEFIPQVRVPQSVISLLFGVVEKLKPVAGQGGRMGYIQGRINLTESNPEKEGLIRSNLEESISKLESKHESVHVISKANKSSEFSEQEVPAELVDACILAQNDDIPILTDDFFYLQLNQLETKKKPPQYTSSLALMRVLYEDGHIPFTLYLDYFNYLAGYRFKHLPVSVEDIQAAILGDDFITQIKIEEIRRFRFELTLSEEYGVQERTAFILVGHILLKSLADDAILPDITERLFSEIIREFPTKKDKKELARTLLITCARVLKRTPTHTLIQRLDEKINRLNQFVQIYRQNDFFLMN